jgi:hypothetical protein
MKWDPEWRALLRVHVVHSADQDLPNEEEP